MTNFIARLGKIKTFVPTLLNSLFITVSTHLHVPRCWEAAGKVLSDLHKTSPALKMFWRQSQGRWSWAGLRLQAQACRLAWGLEALNELVELFLSLCFLLGDT